MANYPTSIDDQSVLLNPVDGSSTKPLATTTTALVLSGDTTINVLSTAGGFVAAYGVLSIGDELVIYTGKTSSSFTGCIRGALGSSAIGHASGVAVKALMCAGYLTRLQDSVVAVQTAVGVTGAFNFAATSHTHDASDLVSGVIAPARLGTGTPGSSNFLRGDGMWASTGSVTSVALTVPSFLSVSGSPVTGAGTLAVSLATEASNSVFAGPTTGSASTPTFRALVAADIPNLAATIITSGVMATARLGTGTPSSSNYLRGDGAWTAVTASTAWGSITGTLSSQSDLNTALSGKQATITGAPGSWPSTFTPAAHASTHQHGGADEVATATPGANAIPKAGSGGTLAAGWIPTLNQNTTGTAAGLTSQYIDWSASAGGASIANKPTIPAAASSTPAMDGTGAAGSSANYARADHVHPTDTTRQAVISGAPGTWPSTFTPSAHASSHAVAGSDPLSLAASQITSGTFAYGRLGSGTPDGSKFLRDDLTWVTPSGGGGGGSGTVTSVALTVPGFLSVSGGPVTSSGTLAVTLATETANYVFAGPTTGAAATPSFRALVAADIPNLSASVITSGTMAVARLGSGSPSSSNYLRGDGAWTAISAGVAASDVDKTGTFASRPAAGTAGVVYLPTDSYFAFRDTGSAWDAWGPVSKLTPPPALSNWTILNQGSSTVDDFRGGIRIVLPNGLATGMRGIYKSAPATPYTATFGFVGVHNNVDGAQIYAGWRESSSGKIVNVRYRRESNPSIRSSKYTSASVFSADYSTQNYPTLSSGALIWFQINDDGTNRNVSVSNDGLNWILFHTVGRTDFCTGDQITFGCDTNGGGLGGYVVLLSYLES